MDDIKKKAKKKKLLWVIFKKVFNLRTLVPLVVILAFNTYAWFIFSTDISTGIDAKVRAWNVMFEIHGTDVNEHLAFSVDEIYPGMTTYTDFATVRNNGDGDAEISFQIESVNILGTVYTVDDITYTNDDVVDILLHDYPFVMSLELTDTIIPKNDEESFAITVSWPYESGDDETDTFWGITAYDFNRNNPTLPSISLEIILSVNQIDEE